MAPGVITADGFLGDDRRSLSSIIDEDAQLLQQLNLDPAETAARLRYFMEEGRRGLGEPVTVDEKWLVTTNEARGHLACPWEDGIFRKINVVLERKDSGQKIFYTDLALHLLEVHGFLEGRGAVFHLDPETLKHVLEEG